MAQVEGTAEEATLAAWEIGLRLLYVLLWLVLFCVGYGVAAMLSLPLDPPRNWGSLLYALTKTEFLSLQTLVLFTVATHFARSFTPPPPGQRLATGFSQWLVKQPFAAIFFGLMIFISPWLIVIGLSGIAYVFAAGLVLYMTPRLLAYGPAGAALLSGAWAMAGFLLAQLTFAVPSVHTCKDDKPLDLRSGLAIPCEDFVFLQDIDAFVIRNEKSAVFVKATDLAPSASKTLGSNELLLSFKMSPLD